MSSEAATPLRLGLAVAVFLLGRWAVAAPLDFFLAAGGFFTSVSPCGLAGFGPRPVARAILRGAVATICQFGLIRLAVSFIFHECPAWKQMLLYMYLF